MPSFEQTADAGMFWNAGEEEEVVKTVLPMKAAKEEIVVEPEDETELEDDANVPLWRAIFKPLRFSECFLKSRKRCLLSQAWIRVDGT